MNSTFESRKRRINAYDDVGAGFEENFQESMEFPFPGGNRRRADVLGDQDRHGTPSGQTLDDGERNNFRKNIRDTPMGQFITMFRQQLRPIPPVRSGVRRGKYIGGAGQTNNRTGGRQSLSCPYSPSTLSAINGFPASSLSTSTPYIARNARPTVRLPLHLISKALNRSPVLTTRSTSDCARERQK